ncbi:YetF domain-containing protein [Brevibacillus porteri]|uniref:YetF domain-containing protein n=1 Tax=Brevibacillus porteri TaxID=2126350 RepID=UPI00363D9F8D
MLKKVEQQFVTKQDVNIQTSSSGMSLPVIVEGKIYPDVLSYRKRDEQWHH